jgi:hypothetical protein
MFVSGQRSLTGHKKRPTRGSALFVSQFQMEVSSGWKSVPVGGQFWLEVSSDLVVERSRVWAISSRARPGAFPSAR